MYYVENWTSLNFILALNSELELLNIINSECSRCNGHVYSSILAKKMARFLRLVLGYLRLWIGQVRPGSEKNRVAQSLDVVNCGHLTYARRHI